jgi:hypothetical protein
MPKYHCKADNVEGRAYAMERLIGRVPMGIFYHFNDDCVHGILHFFFSVN